MTSNPTHSPAPWAYEYNPYSVRETGSGDDANIVGKEIPAFEVFDAEGNKVFDTNEDTPSELQEANACLGAAAPAMLTALKQCAILLADYDENEGEEGEAYRDAITAIAQAESAGGSHDR
jgi:hypothetical protein